MNTYMTLPTISNSDLDDVISFYLEYKDDLKEPNHYHLCFLIKEKQKRNLDDEFIK